MFYLVPPSLESELEEPDLGSDDEYGVVVGTQRKRFMGKMHLALNSRNVDVHRTAIDFGRWFCSVSIAGGALRAENSILYATQIANAFRKSSLCSHSEGVVDESVQNTSSTI